MSTPRLRALPQHPGFECDFETARRLVFRDERRHWDDWGTLYVAPYGSEDSTHWSVIVGAREALVDHDSMFLIMDAPLVLVEKATGEITRHVYLDNFDRMDAMTDVGPWPDDGEE
jgi:hypothetical protein